MPRDFLFKLKVKRTGDVLLALDPVDLVLRAVYVGDVCLGVSLDDLELSVDGEVLPWPKDENDD